MPYKGEDIEGVIVRDEREDKAATTLTITQKPIPLLDSFSNLDKVYWDRTSKHPQLTKKDLIEYYDSVSNYILPHLMDRPLSLSRYLMELKASPFIIKTGIKHSLIMLKLSKFILKQGETSLTIF